MKRMKSFVLILLMWTSLMFPLLTPEVSANPSRDINVYVIKANDSSSSWIGSVNKIEEGVQAAVNDAVTKTGLMLSGENIQLHTITSSADLYQLAVNAPYRAILVNTHGEAVPIPDAYTQNDAGSGGDAGDTFNTAIHVVASSYIGYVADSDTNDWYRFSVQGGANISISVQPTGPNDVDLELYDPMGHWKAGSYSGGSDAVTFTADQTGYWRIRILLYSGWGTYDFTISVQGGGGGGGSCPYVSVWNGSQFIIDNNLLPASEYSNGTDVIDYYKLQQSLALNNNGTYSLTVSEFEREQGFFDKFELLTVDHMIGVNIAVSPNGEILTYTEPYSAVAAHDDSNNNVKALLNSVDGYYYEGHNGSYITLNFGDEFKALNGSKLIVRSDPYLKSPIHVQTMNAAGDWQTVATFFGRTYWSTDIINMTRHLPDARGNLKMRLYFTANDKIDFVGLDTSPQAEISIQSAELLSAIHSKWAEDVKDKMRSEDQVFAELLPSQQIELQFAAPPKDENARTFILITHGHYNTLTSTPFAFPTGPDPPVPSWRVWFDVIAKNCREKGWIWANVAGYPFYYVSNLNKFAGLYQVDQEGLKRYLGRNVVLNYVEGHQAERGYDFSKTGFEKTYPSLLQHNYVYVGRTFNKDAGLPWDALGYVDKTDGSHATVAITMNTTIMSTQTFPGFFIHNGLSNDVNGDGVVNEQDDWLKGYITAAMAIEEARALVSWPIVLTESYGNVHAAAFTVSMRPGDWGKYWDEKGHYGYVRLEFSVGAQYDNYRPFPYRFWYFLTQVDFDISGNSNTRFEVYVAKSGIDTGDKNVEFMNDLYWWNIGTLAGAIPSAGTVLGPGIGLIPIIINYFEPPNHNYTIGNHVWAKEVSFDPNSDDRGTAAMFVEIRFYGIEGQGDTDYTFNVNMASWIGWMDTWSGYMWPRDEDISFNTQLTFTVRWNMI